jgi:hypothetical protein
MTAVDWSKLTPAEAFESLKTAPKVAGPWQGKIGEFSFRADPHGAYAVVSQFDGFRIPGYGGTDGDDQDGRDHADVILRKLGWLLVDEVAT